MSSVQWRHRQCWVAPRAACRHEQRAVESQAVYDCSTGSVSTPARRRGAKCSVVCAHSSLAERAHRQRAMGRSPIAERAHRQREMGRSPIAERAHRQRAKGRTHVLHAVGGPQGATRAVARQRQRPGSAEGARDGACAGGGGDARLHRPTTSPPPPPPPLHPHLTTRRAPPVPCRCACPTWRRTGRSPPARHCGAARGGGRGGREWRRDNHPHTHRATVRRSPVVAKQAAHVLVLHEGRHIVGAAAGRVRQQALHQQAVQRLVHGSGVVRPRRSRQPRAARAGRRQVQPDAQLHTRQTGGG
jgi:hypothetical protein